MKLNIPHEMQDILAIVDASLYYGTYIKHNNEAYIDIDLKNKIDATDSYFIDVVIEDNSIYKFENILLDFDLKHKEIPQIKLKNKKKYIVLVITVYIPKENVTNCEIKKIQYAYYQYNPKEKYSLQGGLTNEIRRLA